MAGSTGCRALLTASPCWVEQDQPRVGVIPLDPKQATARAKSREQQGDELTPRGAEFTGLSAAPGAECRDHPRQGRSPTSVQPGLGPATDHARGMALSWPAPAWGQEGQAVGAGALCIQSTRLVLPLASLGLAGSTQQSPCPFPMHCWEPRQAWLLVYSIFWMQSGKMRCLVQGHGPCSP